MLTWGVQEFGQCGNGVLKEELAELPAVVDTLAKHKVVQIAAGLDHTLALTGISFFGESDPKQNLAKCTAGDLIENIN